MQSNEPEIWKPIAGYEGIYEISDMGRVRSLDRIANNGSRHRGRVRRANDNARGYMQLNLCRESVCVKHSIHRLVADAFLGGPRPELEVRHKNANRGDNRLSNLEWGTHSDNMMDMVAHGNHNQARKTHCPRGHALLMPNLRPDSYRQGIRACLACNREQVASRAGKRLFDPAIADRRYNKIMGAA